MAFVQATCFSIGGGNVGATISGSSTAITTTSGNTLAVFLATYDTDVLNSITDNMGNTYAQLVAFTATVNGLMKITLWAAENIIGGAGHTVSASTTVGNGGRFTCGIMEMGGLAAAPAFDVGVGADQASTTAASSGNATTTQATETLIGGFTPDFGATPTVTAGTGWTIPAGGTLVAFASIYVEYRQVAATGAYAATFTPSPATTADTMIGAFKEYVAVPPQYFRPVSDVAAGGWTTAAGAATGLWDQLNETPAADTDYIGSTATPANDMSEVALSSLSDPLSSTGHIVRYRYRRDVIAGVPIALTVSLLQGSTVIASWAHTDVDDVWTTMEQTLTGAQADSITSYGSLRLRFVANQA